MLWWLEKTTQGTLIAERSLPYSNTSYLTIYSRQFSTGPAPIVPFSDDIGGHLAYSKTISVSVIYRWLESQPLASITVNLRDGRNDIQMRRFRYELRQGEKIEGGCKYSSVDNSEWGQGETVISFRTFSRVLIFSEPSSRSMAPRVFLLTPTILAI